MHLFTKFSALLVAATACASPARFGGPRRRDTGYGDDTSFMVSTVTVVPYGTGAVPTTTTPTVTPTYFPTGTGTNTVLPTAVTGTGTGTPSVVPTVVTITNTLTWSYKKVDGTSTTWVTTTTHHIITETKYHTQYVTIPDVPTSTVEPDVTNAAVEATGSTTTVTSTSTYFTTITVYPNEPTGGYPQVTVDAVGTTEGGCASPVTVTVTEPGSTATVVCFQRSSPSPVAILTLE
ncbi:MAG: hypothetical protein M1840_006074 [Geoglossum simile]|nr:MAG: hypothetical protein M1840_006074 [Geoglossum simile]